MVSFDSGIGKGSWTKPGFYFTLWLAHCRLEMKWLAFKAKCNVFLTHCLFFFCFFFCSIYYRRRLSLLSSRYQSCWHMYCGLADGHVCLLIALASTDMPAFCCWFPGVCFLFSFSCCLTWSLLASSLICCLGLSVLKPSQVHVTPYILVMCVPCRARLLLFF